MFRDATPAEKLNVRKMASIGNALFCFHATCFLVCVTVTGIVSIISICFEVAGGDFTSVPGLILAINAILLAVVFFIWVAHDARRTASDLRDKRSEATSKLLAIVNEPASDCAGSPDISIKSWDARWRAERRKPPGK
jgi:hypothetical protein